MRYELDANGYVLNVYFGCYGNDCEEYTGTIPSGYTNLNEWSEKANINAYYIKDGNLVYDEQRDSELQIQAEIDNENYSCATKKYVNEKLNQSTTIYDDNFSEETTDLYITNSNDSEIPEIIIEGKGSLTEANGSSIYVDDAKESDLKELVIEGKSEQDGTPTPDTPAEIKTIPSIRNLLNNTATTKTINGITFTKNEDGTITANGTATATTIYNLLENEQMTLNVGTYKLHGCPNGGGSSTYKLDIPSGGYPTDTGSGVGFVLNEKTTYNAIRIVVYSGVTLNNVVFKPMIEEGSITHDYVPYGAWAKVKITGKNLLNLTNFLSRTINGITVTKNDNGSITFDGTATTGFSLNCYFDNFELEAGTYTHSIKTDMVSGLYISLDNISETMLNYKNDLSNKKIFTINTTAKYNRYLIWIDNGTSFDNYTFYPMIEKQNNETEYEAYKEKEVLIDLNKPNLLETPYTENNKLTLTATRNDHYWSTNYYAELEAGKTYTFSCKTTGTFGLSTDQTQAYILLDKSYDVYDYIHNKDSYTFTVPTSGKYYLRVDINVNGETHSFWDFAIYEGANATPYYELSSIGDTKDELSIIDGQVVINKKIDKLVLNGSESITSNAYGTNSFNIPITNGKFSADKITTKSSHFTGISYNDRTKEIANSTFISTEVIFTIRNTTFTSVDAFKTWLQSNNATVYYELAEPQQITLPNANIELFEGINHITLVDDLETNISCIYPSTTTQFKDGLKLHITNENVLVNKAIRSTENGLTMTVNDDKSISIKGTATADTEFILNGSIDNIEPIFMLNNSNQFTVSGLDTKVSLNLYSYNGTDRELIYSGTGGDIVLGEPKCITCSTLQVANGTTVNVTIKPSIILNGGDYAEPKANTFITTAPFELKKNEYIKVDRSYIKVIGANENYLKVIEPLRTFKPNTLIQTNSNDISLTTKYFTDDYINERVSKIEVEQDRIKSEVATKKELEDEVSELNSTITQTAEGINSEVAKKVNGTEIISKINQSAEEIKIDGKKISLANFDITDKKLISNITLPYEYTRNDLEKIMNYIMGVVTLTEAERLKYDINKDSVVDALDYVRVNAIVEENITPTNPGKFEINTAPNELNVINLYDGSGNLKYYIGYWISKLKYLTTESLTTNSITSGNIDSGRCVLTSSGDRTIYFNKTFSIEPNVVLTPLTRTNGVIAGKITEITTTYFKANIGGTSFGDNEFCWIAIS